MQRKKSKPVREKVLISSAKTKRIESLSELADELRLNESYKSLLLGIAVVMLAAVLVIGYAKNRNAQNMQTTTKEVAAGKVEKKVATLGEYTIVAGDDLKTISRKYYETPDLFLFIAKANAIANPDTIEEGEKLQIPKIDKKQFVPSLIPSVSKEPITDAAYTLQEGDLLWNIAIRAYGDGNKWKDIVSANNLQDPDAIFSGMILQLPR